MNDRERIFRACVEPAELGLLDELERDCIESRVIDQVLGLADLSKCAAVGIMDALRIYPVERWTLEESIVVLQLALSIEWWLDLIAEGETKGW